MSGVERVTSDGVHQGHFGSLVTKGFRPNIALYECIWVVGGFKHFCIFTLKIGEDEPNLTIIFFKGVETTHQCCMVLRLL